MDDSKNVLTPSMVWDPMLSLNVVLTCPSNETIKLSTQSIQQHACSMKVELKILFVLETMSSDWMLACAYLYLCICLRQKARVAKANCFPDFSRIFFYILVPAINY